MDSLRSFASLDHRRGDMGVRTGTAPRLWQCPSAPYCRPTLAFEHRGGTVKAWNHCFLADLSGARPRRWESEFLSIGLNALSRVSHFRRSAKTEMKIQAAIVKPIILIATAIALFMMPGLKLPYLDKKADAYFSDAMTKAGVAYGVCRVVNASVSVIKESQIQIEPVGIGVSLAAGQILDPLDDMTERASDILITAIVSIGIQKIAYEISVAFAPALLALAIISFVIASLSRGVRAKAIRGIILKSIILIAVARLCLPTSSIISSYLNDHYFSPEISKAKDELAMSSPEMERLKDMRMPEFDGVVGTMKNGFDFVKGKTSDLAAALKAMIQNMGSMVQNLLKISYLYVALFIIQVILLPIGAFWLLTRIANALFGTAIPYILKHKDLIHKIRGGNETKEA